MGFSFELLLWPYHKSLDKDCKRLDTNDANHLKGSLITSSDASTHLRPGLKRVVGSIFAGSAA